jgi:hypothetical protein
MTTEHHDDVTRCDECSGECVGGRTKIGGWIYCADCADREWRARRWEREATGLVYSESTGYRVVRYDRDEEREAE